jgi:dTDP-4-amino-4,6-dideoxygalactose transaminase
MLSFYKKMGFNIQDYPATYDNFSREITLPVFYDLTDEQLSIVCDAVNASVAEVLHATVS